MRSSGVLLPISSLPTKYGIGTFGKEAYEFVDSLKRSGQKYWQVLPLVATSYGDSPYQSFSTFAGNPYFIDLEMLIKQGLLSESDCERGEWGTNPSYVDYAKMYISKNKILEHAYNRSGCKNDPEYNKFVEANESWIEEYALFMALKAEHNGVSYTEWEDDVRLRKQTAIDKAKEKLVHKMEFYKFVQYKFFEQWTKLKNYANENDVLIIGDLPIYVAMDSADTWSKPELFLFDKKGAPTQVAGCPPDAYAVTGQLWGNPIYKWSVHKKTKYEWWVERMRHAVEMYDVVRIDHFRGFADYYSIDAEETTAENGEWVKGPGIDLFKAIKRDLGDCNIIAEDLGFITPSVAELLEKTGFPGMKVLQFAFYADSDSEYLPHSCNKNSVCYTGTHDNPTTKQWLETLTPEDKQFMIDYLGCPTPTSADLVRSAMACGSDMVITPMQDLLNLGEEARMNTPSTIGGNWEWRLLPNEFNTTLEKMLHKMTKIYGRLPKDKV